MPYCPHCGNEVEHAIEAAAPATEAFSAEVEIARINRAADVEIAKIQARQAREELETVETVAEIEAVADVAEAEATAEVVAEVLAAETGDDAETDPIIIDAPEAEAEAEPEPDVPEPPPADEPKEPARSGGNSNPWWR